MVRPADLVRLASLPVLDDLLDARRRERPSRVRPRPVRLSIAQPALSKAIRWIENRLGVALFVRSSRHVEPTSAGKALQEHGRHALNAVSVAVRHAQSAGGTQSHLRLVLKPGGDGGLLPGMLAAYAEQPDARHVDILFSGPTDRAEWPPRSLCAESAMRFPHGRLAESATGRAPAAQRAPWRRPATRIRPLRKPT